MNWNELKDKHFKWACENGQHDTEHAYSHWAMLIITEISEAVQAERAGNVASREMFELNEEYNIMPFQANFESFIKDTIEDEIADIILRILDYCGLHNIDLSNIEEETDAFLKIVQEKGLLKGELLTDLGYYLCKMFTENNHITLESFLMTHAISCCLVFCKLHDIDIMWHIQQKMKYNQTRPHLNGKRY